MSQKYGIGYLLSNGNYGVVFNDGSSLTRIQQDGVSINPERNYCYFHSGKVEFYSKISKELGKKSEILKMCEKKLANYRSNHILIPYYSEVYAKKWIPLGTCFGIKMSNAIIQFFWDSDSITLRGYKWIKWRVNE